MTLLNVTGLQTHFHTSRGVVKAVDGVDLSIGEGEIVGLVGESGSGKSVFAESIMRLVEEPGKIVDGDIRLQGESLLEKSEREMQSIRGNSISMVFQDPMNSLNPTLTVGEQIAEAIRLHNPEVGESITLPSELKRKLIGSSRNSEAWRRAIRMLESVQIPEPAARAKDFPFEFSGGMRQRAMIAMALSCEPDLLIADEPTTALDVTIEAQILDELRQIRDKFNTSILLITHDLAVVSEVCERVNVMYAGEIVEHGPARELFENPQHPYMQSLLKSIPSPDGSTETLEPISGNVPDLIDIPYACHFAPRCPEAKRECYETEPRHREVGAHGHEAACLRRGPRKDRI
jgi:oligopeptide/dipeptide ABC transporter ATP-binding protein